MDPEPDFQRLFVLAGGKAPAQMLPNEREVTIAGAAVPWIIARVIPEQLELMGNERADLLGHLLQVSGEVPRYWIDLSRTATPWRLASP